MTNAIILHGKPSKEEYYDPAEASPSNQHWLPWLQRQLLLQGILAQTPEMPRPYQPDYNLWKAEFEHYPINAESILIGHSCGGGFLVRWLSEHPVSVDTVTLVAPWLDPFREVTTDFFDFAIDPALTNRIRHFHLLISDNDEASIPASLEIIQKSLRSVKIHRFSNLGHFTQESMGHIDFPELLQIIAKTQGWS